MTDVLGWRRKFGVLGPSTNTVVQPDFDDMRPRGVTNHYSRIYTPNADAVSNEIFRAGAEVIAGNTLDAVRSVMTSELDYLVMGMSAVTLFRRRKGADRFTQSGLEDVPASRSASAAMPAMRPCAPMAASRASRCCRRTGRAMNTEVARYFGDKGFSVVRDKALECTLVDQHRRSRPRRHCAPSLKKLDGDDIDAIVQVGTNLLDGAPRRRRRDVARQTHHRDQHRHLYSGTPLRANGIIRTRWTRFGRLSVGFLTS